MSQAGPGPVRVVRVIARLNVVGPAIQAITLTTLLEARGYATTLVRGREEPDEGRLSRQRRRGPGVRQRGHPRCSDRGPDGGLAVISTDVGGTRSVVAHGETGLLAASADASQLAAAVRQLHAAPELAAELGRRGRERCFSRFGLDRLVDDVDRLYRDRLAGRKPGGR